MNAGFDRQEWEDYQAVEAALQTLPLAEVQPGFTVEVMQRVRASARPAFRLQLIDYVLSVCAAGMFGVAALLSGSLPPYLDLYIRQEVLYWLQWLYEQQLNPLNLLLLLGGAAQAILVGLAASLLLLRGLRSSRAAPGR